MEIRTKYLVDKSTAASPPSDVSLICTVLVPFCSYMDVIFSRKMWLDICGYRHEPSVGFFLTIYY
jgi:hypothetical protein